MWFGANVCTCLDFIYQNQNVMLNDMIWSSKQSYNIWSWLSLEEFCILKATSTLFLFLYSSISDCRFVQQGFCLTPPGPWSLWTDHHGWCLELMRNFHSALKAFYSWYSSLWCRSLRALLSVRVGSQLAQDQVLTGGVQDYNMQRTRRQPRAVDKQSLDHRN